MVFLDHLNAISREETENERIKLRKNEWNNGRR